MSELFVSLITFSAASTISPGGATTLAVASGARFGILRSMPLLSGLAVGLAALMGAAAIGLTAVTRALPQLELWLRIFGTGYFLWLAWRVAQQGAPSSHSVESGEPMGFVVGMASLWANPKAWAVAVAAASGYVGLADSAVGLAITLGAVFGLAAALSLSIWCAGGAWLSRIIGSEMQWRAVNIVLGLLLVASIILMWR